MQAAIHVRIYTVKHSDGIIFCVLGGENTLMGSGNPPQVGSYWNFGILGDSCTLSTTVSRVQCDEGGSFFLPVRWIIFDVPSRSMWGRREIIT